MPPGWRADVAGSTELPAGRASPPPTPPAHVASNGKSAPRAPVATPTRRLPDPASDERRPPGDRRRAPRPRHGAPIADAGLRRGHAARAATRTEPETRVVAVHMHGDKSGWSPDSPRSRVFLPLSFPRVPDRAPCPPSSSRAAPRDGVQSPCAAGSPRGLGRATRGPRRTLPAQVLLRGARREQVLGRSPSARRPYLLARHVSARSRPRCGRHAASRPRITTRCERGTAAICRPCLLDSPARAARALPAIALRRTLIAGLGLFRVGGPYSTAMTRSPSSPELPPDIMALLLSARRDRARRRAGR
ncbi:hypothetical protein VTO73DRAFT_13843 [Trametes versicolor]